MAEEEKGMTEEEAQSLLREFQEARQSAFSFFTNVIKSKDTTKTGNLTQEELGNPKVPLRTFKQLHLFCKDVWGQEKWAEYFEKLGEIHTATSLSKDALLIKLAVTQKKELADTTPEKERKKNRGMFGFKKQRG